MDISRSLFNSQRSHRIQSVSCNFRVMKQIPPRLWIRELPLTVMKRNSKNEFIVISWNLRLVRIGNDNFPWYSEYNMKEYIDGLICKRMNQNINIFPSRLSDKLILIYSKTPNMITQQQPPQTQFPHGQLLKYMAKLQSVTCVSCSVASRGKVE